MTILYHNPHNNNHNNPRPSPLAEIIRSPIQYSLPSNISKQTSRMFFFLQRRADVLAPEFPCGHETSISIVNCMEKNKIKQGENGVADW